MNIKTLVLSEYQSNCYIVESDDEGIIIDPGEANNIILDEVKGIDIKYIVNTHAHPDHIHGNQLVKDALNVPIIIPELDLEMYKVVSGSEPAEDDLLVNAGDVIEVGSLKFGLMHTPGHTPGHLILIEENERVIFVGDLVFMGSIGRTDFPGGSDLDMQHSLQQLVNLDGDWKLYPGHGPVTTLNQERQTNPFLVDFH